jgi:hypothetical protein
MRTVAQVLARRRAKPRARRYFRHRAAFVRDPLAHSTPLDRNDRARLIFLAEQLERRTKDKGRKNGVLGNVGLEVLRALLFRFADSKTGLCFPSYLALQTLTGRCRGAIAAAVRRLEHAGIIRVTRRLKRIVVARLSPITGQPANVLATVQDSNLYGFSEPQAFAARLDSHAEAPRRHEPGQLDLLTRLARGLAAESTAQEGSSGLLDLWRGGRALRT